MPACRAGRNATLELTHRVGVALGLDFDSSIGQIADKAVQSFASGHCLGKKTEADALNAAADEIASPLAHVDS